jgi:DNA-binding NtrC family response regulator
VNLTALLPNAQASRLNSHHLMFISWTLKVVIFHYNDEEKQLHQFLAERGHHNIVIPAEGDPFGVVQRELIEAAFVGLHPHGLRLMRALHQRNPDCLVTVITSDRDTRMAVEAMKQGAFHYMLSPLDFSEVERTYILMTREWQGQHERRTLQAQLAEAEGAERLVGVSEPMRRLRRILSKAAAGDSPVMITGEQGVGKGLVARMVHEQSPRRERPFLSINCGSIPKRLLEYELLGYKRGAFQGAEIDRHGLLTQADGGSFLFDEVNDLDLLLQGKILRVLQEGQLIPVGAHEPQRVDVRFIAACHQDISALIQQRRFRRDLFFRLNVFPIHVPPLRERREDIALLARVFLDKYSRKSERPVLKVEPSVWRWLSNYEWPGNVRELENLCQRAVALTENETFDTDLLRLTASFGVSPEDDQSAEPAAAAGVIGDYVAERARMDKQLFERALREQGGNISRAARVLGVSRTTFYAKAKKLGITLPRQRIRTSGT